jgi:O-antigen ligase
MSRRDDPFETSPHPEVYPECIILRSVRHPFPAFWLCLIVSLSFVFHFFSAVLSPRFYVMAVAAAVAGLVVSKPRVPARPLVALLCLLAIGCMAFSFWRSTRLMGAFADVLTLGSALFVVLFPVSRPDDYRPALTVIVLWGVFFSVGMLLAFGARPLFNASLSMFPSAFAAAVRRASFVRICGFSTNPGFTAGYVVCALIALSSVMGDRKSFSLSKLFLLVFLLVALLFTGKRGHVLFLAVTWGLCYLIPLRGNKKVARYVKLGLCALVGVVLYVAFADALAGIPVVGRFAQTVSGFLEGEDVSNGRSRLWSWALELVRRQPWLGIGWGDFRTTIGGVAGIVSELDVHNIYLQLLCETGVVGLAVFALFFAYFWNSAKNLSRLCVASSDPVLASLRPLVRFSLAYQTFFLLYGITGNVLFDQHYQIVYAVACAIAVTCQSVCRRRIAALRWMGGYL